MKKPLIAALAIAAVALLAVPQILGRLTEKQIRARAADLDGGAWSLEIKSYDRGWFRSHAVIEVGLSPGYAAGLPPSSSPGAAAGAPPGMPVAIDVAHGPVAVLDGAYLGWSKLVARADGTAPQVAALEQQLGVPQLFEFRSRTSLLGATSFDGAIPKLDVPLEVGSVRVSGGAFAGTVRGNRVQSEGHVDSIELSTPGADMALRGLRAAIDLDIHSRAVLLGTTSVTLDNVSVTSALLGSALFDASSVTLGSDVALDGSRTRLGIGTSYDIATMTVGGVQLTNASIGLGLRDIDVDAFEAYRKATDEFLRTQDSGALQSAVMRVLAAHPTVALDPVRVLADGEPFEARLELTPNDRVSADSLAFFDPAELAGILNGNAEINISRRLAERIAQQALRMQAGFDPSVRPEQLEEMLAAQSDALLLMLASQGIVEANGTGFHAKVELADGELRLNGRPMPLGLQ